MRFHSMRASARQACLYGWGDSNGLALAKLFRSPPSYPTVDDSGSTYEVTLGSWFHSERIVLTQLEIEPPPPRSAQWLDLTG